MSRNRDLALPVPLGAASALLGRQRSSRSAIANPAAAPGPRGPSVSAFWLSAIWVPAVVVITGHCGLDISGSLLSSVGSVLDARHTPRSRADP
jgi:hypothetical protein